MSLRIRSLALVVGLALLGISRLTAQGTPMPYVIQFLDNNGNPCAGCLLDTFVSGTTTPQATYSNAALTVANTQPVVADAAGRMTVFLSPVSYTFRLRTAAGVTLWTRDGVSPIPSIFGAIVGSSLAVSGNVVATGSVIAGSLGGNVNVFGGDLMTNRGGVSPGSGNIWFGSSNGLHFLFFDGTNFLLSSPLTVTGALTATGNITSSAGNVAGGTTLSVTLTAGNNNNLTPAGMNGAILLRLTPDAGATSLTGVSGGRAGRMLYLSNISPPGTVIVIEGEDGASVAANRFGENDHNLGIGGTNAYVYDGTALRWRWVGKT